MSEYECTYEVWVIAPHRSECALRTDDEREAVTRCREMSIDRFYNVRDRCWEAVT